MREHAGEYLVCERRSVFALLTLSAGMMGAYTFNLRGGVFCNAQTANVVLMAIAFGAGDWAGGAYYLIPIGAYFLGPSCRRSCPLPCGGSGSFGGTPTWWPSSAWCCFPSGSSLSPGRTTWCRCW